MSQFALQPYHGGHLAPYALSFLLAMVLLIMARLLSRVPGGPSFQLLHRIYADLGIVGGTCLALQGLLERVLFVGRPRFLLLGFYLLILLAMAIIALVHYIHWLSAKSA